MSGVAHDDRTSGTGAPLHDVMRTMRAMRRLSPEPVPRELLEKLVEAATWAPSGSNAQSYSWVIVTDRAAIRRLEPIWARAYEVYFSTIPVVAGDTMDEDAVARLHRAVTFQRDHFSEIPALLVACYDSGVQRTRMLRSAPVMPWRLLSRIGLRHTLRTAVRAPRASRMAEAGSVYPGVQNLLLTARALGLGATLTTWHLAFEGEVKKVLGIPRHVTTFAAIPVGWPLGRFGPVGRRPASEVIHWDRW